MDFLTDNYKSEWLTVFITASKEKEELVNTINVVLDGCGDNLYKAIVVLKDENCPSAAVVDRYISENPSCKVVPYVQKYKSEDNTKSFLGCFAEIPYICVSSHFIITTADIENSSDTLKRMIDESKNNPDAIVCASRWMKGSTVNNYNKLSEIIVKSFNLFISVLYGKRVTDFSSIFQIFPVKVLNRLKMKQTEEFGFTYTLIPLYAKEKYIEVPAEFIKNKTSSFGLITLYKVGFGYMYFILKIRFKPRKYFLK